MTYKIIQITDTHLFEDPTVELLEVCTNKRFESVLSHVNQHHADADLMVISGDLVHDDGAAYQRLHGLLTDWHDRLEVIPGNHDVREALTGVFPCQTRLGDQHITFDVKHGGWRIIGLDTLIAGRVEGDIDDAQWDWLENILVADGDSPTAIFMHHPPVIVGSKWVDKLGLVSFERFNVVVEENSQIKLVICGHIHQQYSQPLGQAMLYTTPSTSVQFLPGATEFTTDSVDPGYRTIAIEHDASFVTEVIRVANAD